MVIYCVATKNDNDAQKDAHDKLLAENSRLESNVYSMNPCVGDITRLPICGLLPLPSIHRKSYFSVSLKLGGII